MFEMSYVSADMRALVMKPSLDAAGRFDKQRIRRRFLDTFLPEDMTKLIVDDQL